MSMPTVTKNRTLSILTSIDERTQKKRGGVMCTLACTKPAFGSPLGANSKMRNWMLSTFRATNSKSGSIPSTCGAFASAIHLDFDDGLAYRHRWAARKDRARFPRFELFGTTLARSGSPETTTHHATPLVLYHCTTSIAVFAGH